MSLRDYYGLGYMYIVATKGRMRRQCFYVAEKGLFYGPMFVFCHGFLAQMVFMVGIIVKCES